MPPATFKSPTHSTGSTQLNTPRIESQDSSSSVQQIIVSSPTSSDASRKNKINIHPTWPKNIDIIDAPAVVSWPSDGRLASPALLNLHWTSQHNNGGPGVFFKIHARVQLSDARRPTSFFLYIPSERIRHLSVQDAAPAVQEQQQSLGPYTRTLVFQMLQLAPLVFPKNYHAANPDAEKIIKSLYTLATQWSFTVHAKIRPRPCSIEILQQICDDVSTRNLPSIDRFAFHRTATLYQGQGAQVIEGNSLVDNHLQEAGSGPPAYSPVSNRKYKCHHLCLQACGCAKAYG